MEKETSEEYKPRIDYRLTPEQIAMKQPFQQKVKVILNELNGLSMSNSEKLLDIAKSILEQKINTTSIEENEQHIDLLIEYAFRKVHVNIFGNIG